MTFSVTVLGSSAWYATRERAASGYLVDFGETRIILDAGGGTWLRLLEVVDFKDVHGVLLSHRHPDHTIDLFQLFHARQYGGDDPMEPIPLWAPPETLDRVLAFTSQVDEAFDLRPVRPADTFEIDGARVSFCEMTHPPETVGVRIERDGAVFAYSADTGPEFDLARLASNADIFLCEATYQNDDELWEGHMSAAQAGEAAAKAGAANLVLTHLPPGRDFGISLAEAHKVAGGVAVQLAADGLKLELAS
ncbi:MAG: MBL fold metallo-hydrolase [Actinomycetota bacterium]|nr:MBL fold metallo-hydrolase [Actinomycetota bacterium]